MARWRTGDQRAADALFERYTERLMAVARSRLSERLAPRVDPEDVVQSAFRSFFVGARDGRYALEQSGDLWRLLVAITLHKLRHQVERHTAGKRAIDREYTPVERWQDGRDGRAAIDPRFLAAEPSPEEAAALADEVEHVMRRLDPLRRRMLELRLQGYLLDEIAVETDRSQRTVRRMLEQLKAYLEERYRVENDAIGVS